MNVEIDPKLSGGIREKKTEIPYVPEIKEPWFRKFYNWILRVLTTALRALADAKEAVRDKAKEREGWVKRIMEFITNILKLFTK